MRPFPILRAQQALAADPAVHAWVSASAGAGKTQLLAARVLRLLLAGAAPDRLLALTFTKAAAAEMRARVLDRLGHWASADDAALARDLSALGLAPDAGLAARARGLFVQALGGLRIETIHAFAAGLLAAFPFEAGISADFTILDDRTAAELDQAALDNAIAHRAYPGFTDDLADLSIRHGEAGLGEVLGVLARHAADLEMLGDSATHEAAMRVLLDLAAEGDAAAVLCAALVPPHVDHVAIQCFAALLARYGGKNGPEKAAVLEHWLESDAPGRCGGLDTVARIFITQEGTLNKKLVLAAMHSADNGCHALAGQLFEMFVRARDVAARLDLAAFAAKHLRVGWAVARERTALQERLGVLAFDDIIARAARMLSGPGAADWVRAKLDQRIDHILVDEAQDTNADQWAIVTALAGEFFAGEGARGGHRTLFAVGDHKQSIFGFQGADPAVFVHTRNALRLAGADILDVPLADNFRSVPAILDVVDAVLGRLGPEALGLAEPVPRHAPERAGQPGAVTLWPCVGDEAGDDGEEGDDGTEEAADAPDAERGWVSTNERRMADRLAKQIRTWLDDATPLPARARPIAPGDMLVLVRKRGAFVGALVAALHREGVPVAGADRLALTATLAVKDCISLVRFVLQPADDLALAELLVSPFLGWIQDELFALAHDRPATLWDALRDAATPHARTAREWLLTALRIADFGSPYAFLEQIMSGGLAGRARLLARLGEADRLAVDELLSAALAFEADHAPSLQGFLAWTSAGSAELKRDPDAPRGEVRIMTVHGAKGLQAPVVILADAAQPPEADRARHVMVGLGGARLPVFHGGKPGKIGAVGEACAAAVALGKQEKLRLLYVALTRAEDLLFVGGALHKKKEGAHEESWYAVISEALTGLGASEIPGVWDGASRVYAPGGTALRPEVARAVPAPATPLPAWAHTAAPVEARPPRPLTPSRIGTDDAATPPAGRASAERGRLLHALFERLPEIATEARSTAGAAWLARAAPALAEAERGELLAAVLRVVENPAHAVLFGPGSLAEAPLAATIGGTVIAGKLDRLLIEPGRVLVVDYKTGARVPASAEAAPPAHLRQMAAYYAALASIFPDSAVEAALLYTAGPKWIALPPALLASHAPDA